MALSKIKNDSDLIITVQTGVDKDGNEVYKKHRFSKIKVDAEDQKVFDVANAIVALIDAVPSGIDRVDAYGLVNEA